MQKEITIQLSRIEIKTYLLVVQNKIDTCFCFVLFYNYSTWDHLFHLQPITEWRARNVANQIAALVMDPLSIADR